MSYIYSFYISLQDNTYRERNLSTLGVEFVSKMSEWLPIIIFYFVSMPYGFPVKSESEILNLPLPMAHIRCNCIIFIVPNPKKRSQDHTTFVHILTKRLLTIDYLQISLQLIYSFLCRKLELLKLMASR